LELGAATGALLLFGTVQLTMGAVGYVRGERLDVRARWGWTAAAAGLVVLLLPGVQAPAPWAAAAMVAAGVAWAAYSLAGRGERAALAANARNFAWALPVAAALAVWPGAWAGATGAGVALAVASGALTSGLGYAAWYVALPSLSRSAAAVVQLAVPVVAAAGGVALLGETLDGRLIAAGMLVLGGIAAVVAPRAAVKA
jgi:drug/metabolite transporter (DMT)-like permease